MAEVGRDGRTEEVGVGDGLVTTDSSLRSIVVAYAVGLRDHLGLYSVSGRTEDA